MVAIQAGPSGIKEKEIGRVWPVTEGLEAGTNTQEGRVMNLVVQEESLVDQRETVGL